MTNFDRPRTRPPLSEIPAGMGHLRPTTPTTRAVLNAALIDSPINNIPLSFLSPALSPDELVIQQRGRRRIPISWSPDKNVNINTSPTKTPTKGISAMVLRSSPRKRTLMMDYSPPRDEHKTSPRKTPSKQGSSSTKKFKIEETPINKSNTNVSLVTLLQGMSQQQLINIIQGVVDKNPQLEETVRAELPMPDLNPLEEKLANMKKNIVKSLPTSRLVSKTDSAAYSRASTHLAMFKKTIIDQAKTLYDSTHWDSLLDYTMMTWNYVRSTPVWDNQTHNSVRRHCFKILSYNAISALKNGGIELGEHRLNNFVTQLKAMSADCEDINVAIQYLEYILHKI